MLIACNLTCILYYITFNIHVQWIPAQKDISPKMDKSWKTKNAYHIARILM